MDTLRSRGRYPVSRLRPAPPGWRAIARSGILIDQVNEFGRWCHVGFAPKGTPPGTNYSLANAAIGYELGSRNP